MVHAMTTSGMMVTPSYLSEALQQSVREVIEACGDDPRVNYYVLTNSYSMGETGYAVWLRDMLSCYPIAKKSVTFTHRAGVPALILLISGLASTRRRVPGLTVDQCVSLVIASFVLKGFTRPHSRRDFYVGQEEESLRDPDLVRLLASGVDTEKLAQIIVTTSGDEYLRPAEVESALRGDQAPVLSKGAL